MLQELVGGAKQDRPSCSALPAFSSNTTLHRLWNWGVCCRAALYVPAPPRQSSRSSRTPAPTSRHSTSTRTTPRPSTGKYSKVKEVHLLSARIHLRSLASRLHLVWLSCNLPSLHVIPVLGRSCLSNFADSSSFLNLPRTPPTTPQHHHRRSSSRRIYLDTTIIRRDPPLAHRLFRAPRRPLTRLPSVLQ